MPIECNREYKEQEKVRMEKKLLNLLAHNNISQICYCGQISSQSG